MVLQIWNADIDYEKEGLAKLPIWIQLYNVPLQFWTAAGLSFIASSVGKPLYADEMTETAKRISYAKICVEVDVAASLPHLVDLLTASWKTVSIAIKYPWRPAKCVSCNVFGHSECRQQVMHPSMGVDISTEVAPKGKVWVVKSGGGEPIPTQPAGLDPTVIRSGSSVGELPCSNHFDVLKLMNDPDDAARVKVLDSVVAEVIIDSEVLVNKEAMDIACLVRL